MTEVPRVSVVVPAYNEGENVVPVLDRLFESVRLPCELLLVVDSPDDTTVPVAHDYAEKEPRLKTLINTYGRGPANAIRYGIDHAAAPVAVVTMADGCDDARQIDELVRLVERGVAVAAASRYMPGGPLLRLPDVHQPRLRRHPGGRYLSGHPAAGCARALSHAGLRFMLAPSPR